MKVKIKLHEGAAIPKKAYPSDAGFDLVATNVRIDSSARFIEYDTDVSIEIPEGYVGLLYPRSSISKYDLMLYNGVGVIDSLYRGTLKFRFKALGPHHYKVGDRIGQLVIMPIPTVELEEVDTLEETERGSGAFGSSDG